VACRVTTIAYSVCWPPHEQPQCQLGGISPHPRNCLNTKYLRFLRSQGTWPDLLGPDN